MRISDWSSDVCSSDLKGDEVANGIITAMGRVDIGVPIVIRLDGTNADEGRSILEPHLSEKLQMASTMVEAAKTAVPLAATSENTDPWQSSSQRPPRSPTRASSSGEPREGNRWSET